MRQEALQPNQAVLGQDHQGQVMACSHTFGQFSGNFAPNLGPVGPIGSPAEVGLRPRSEPGLSGPTTGVSALWGAARSEPITAPERTMSNREEVVAYSEHAGLMLNRCDRLQQLLPLPFVQPTIVEIGYEPAGAFHCQERVQLQTGIRDLLC
jgi:hypothetical protein